MNIVFLGTGAAEGIPAFRCSCDCCNRSREKGGKNLRQNASIYIEGDEGERFLIDCPMQVKTRLNDFNIDETGISDIFLTHYHEDHTNGLFFISQTRDLNGFMIEKPINIHMAELTYKRTDWMFEADTICSRNIIREYEPVRVGEFELIPLETNHLSRERNDGLECFGYLIRGRESCFAYIVDASSQLPESTLEELEKQEIDCLMYDCTFSDLKIVAGHSHSDIKGAVALKKRLNPRKMIITHISHRNHIHDELSELMADHDILTAWDGMEISI